LASLSTLVPDFFRFIIELFQPVATLSKQGIDMTDLQKRSLLKLAALTAVASAALVGCGKKEEPAPAPAPVAAAPAAASTQGQNR
jgi:hypothetical protein